MEARFLNYPKQGKAELKSTQLPALKHGEVLIKSLYSGISRGTERLVYNGKIPESEFDRMRCPHQRGEFSFPISYGYQLVGEILKTHENVNTRTIGNKVFLLHPHQDFVTVDESAVNLLPRDVSLQRATLCANMETALNASWDGQLTAENKVLVVGAGVVGLLTAFVSQKMVSNPVTLVDTDERKRVVAEQLGLSFVMPDSLNDDYDRIFHTTANPHGLQMALDHAAFEARLIEMSWYGDKPVTLTLGGTFHSKRLQIISSQVGHVSPSRRATTTYKDRMGEAIQLLVDPRLDCLLEDAIAFEDLPDALNRVFDPEAAILSQVVAY